MSRCRQVHCLSNGGPKSSSSQHDEASCCDADSEVNGVATRDRGSMNIPPTQSFVEKPTACATPSRADSDCKLSCDAVSIPMMSRAVMSHKNRRISSNTSNTDVKVVAPHNSPAVSHGSQATFRHSDFKASLKKAVWSLDAALVREQKEQPNEAQACSLAQESESPNEPSQEQRYPSRTPKRKREEERSTSVGRPRRSARLHEPVPKEEEQPEDPRILAVLELQDGSRLRIVSENSDVTTCKHGQDSSISNVAKPIDKKKPFPILVHRMVSETNQGNPFIMRWEHDGAAFSMDSNHPDLPAVLGNYFQHRNYSSLQRQLSIYGWKKYNPKGKSNSYKGTFFNPLFHRDKSDAELTEIYRGCKPSSHVPELNSVALKTPPRRSSRGPFSQLRPVSQEEHPLPSPQLPPPSTPVARVSSRDEPLSTGSTGIGGELADMLLYLKNTPIPSRERAVDGNEDISPIRILPLVQERVDTQLDSPMNDLRMLTPNGDTIFCADPTRNCSIKSIPSEARWKVFSRLNGSTDEREIDDMSDISVEGNFRASEIFETPSGCLRDVSTLHLSLHTIEPSSSTWGCSSSAVKGFQKEPSQGLTPIIVTLDTAFRAADQQYQSTTATVLQEDSNKQLFYSTQAEEINVTTNALLGSCAVFSPLVPKFSKSGWTVLLPEVHSRTEQDAPSPWTGDDRTATSTWFLPSPVPVHHSIH